MIPFADDTFYGPKREDVLNRICNHCSSNDPEDLALLKQQPFFNPIIEDEQHILSSCSLYDTDRIKLRPETRDLIGSSEGLKLVFNNASQICETARYLKKCHERRFPKKHPTKIEEPGLQR